MKKRYVYLNNAATSFPKPQEVEQAVLKSIRDLPKNVHRGGMFFQDKMDAHRKRIAKFLGVRNHKRLFFTSGSTEAINLIMKGYDLCRGHIITTATEHNSVLRPLYHRLRVNMSDATIVPCDATGYVSPDDIRNAIQLDTAFIVVNHCSNVTGTVQDIAEIAAIAREHQVKLLVDASQSAGNIEIRADKLGIDMLAFTGHKSLFGTTGTGGIYIKEGISVIPLKTGGTGYKSRELEYPREEPHIFEAGTQNYTGIAAMAAGVDFIKKQTLEKIQEHKKKLVSMFVDEFEGNPWIKLYHSKTKSSYTLISFNIENLEAEEAAFILANSFSILVRGGLHCAPLIHKYLGSEPHGTIRVSPGYFTTEQEMRELIEAVYKLIDYAKKQV